MSPRTGIRAFAFHGFAKCHAALILRLEKDVDGLRSGEVLAGDRHFGRRVEAQIKKPLRVTPRGCLRDERLQAAALFPLPEAELSE